MVTKGNVVLYLDKELVEKSKSLGFNLSKTFENHLKHLIMQFSQCNTASNFISTSKSAEWWAGPDSDRRPSARQEDVLTNNRKNVPLCSLDRSARIRNLFRGSVAFVISRKNKTLYFSLLSISL
jgi:hypothetical protein